jgi:hypothetical protein
MKTFDEYLEMVPQWKTDSARRMKITNKIWGKAADFGSHIVVYNKDGKASLMKKSDQSIVCTGTKEECIAKGKELTKKDPK